MDTFTFQQVFTFSLHLDDVFIKKKLFLHEITSSRTIFWMSKPKYTFYQDDCTTVGFICYQQLILESTFENKILVLVFYFLK